MLSDSVKLDLIPSSLLQSWAQDTPAKLLAVLARPGINLGHLEELPQAQSDRLTLPILAAATQWLADRQPFCCPTCPHPLLAQDQNRPRTLRSVFGSLPLKRDYGWGPHCQSFSPPADAALGLQPLAPASPKVPELAALPSIRSPYGVGARDAQRLTGAGFNAAFPHREVQRQGQRALALRRQAIALAHTPPGLAELSARSGTAQLGPFTRLIQIDAWNIRERDDWGRTQALRRKHQEPERWHWVFNATIFRLDQRGQTAGGRRVVVQRGHVETREALDSFAQQLYVEALLRGPLQAEEALIIADGAIWIWKLAEDRFKGAKPRVDLFHVKEHLHELARTLYDSDPEAARQWLKPLLGFLDRRKDGALDVLHHLEDLRKTLKGLRALQREALDKEIGYFTTHQQRMDYKEGKLAGEPVGSGVVESTGRQYQTRFKCAGQFWTPAGDEALLALVNLYRNERWHLLFPHAKPIPTITPTTANN